MAIYKWLEKDPLENQDDDDRTITKTSTIPEKDVDDIITVNQLSAKLAHAEADKISAQSRIDLLTAEITLIKNTLNI